MIAPFYKQLSTKFPNALFLKVDVDKCPGTAAANEVTSMPTFIFFRNRAILDRMKGANKPELENKVKQHYENSAGASEEGATATTSTPNGEYVNNLFLIFSKWIYF